MLKNRVLARKKGSHIPDCKLSFRYAPDAMLAVVIVPIIGAASAGGPDWRAISGPAGPVIVGAAAEIQTWIVASFPNAGTW